MTAPSFAATEPVTILRATTAADQFGDPTGDPASRVVEGCVVWPAGGNSSPADERTFQEDTVFVGYTVLMPPGTDVVATDRVNLRGIVYEVIGEPGRFSDPFGSFDPGVVVTIRRAT